MINHVGQKLGDMHRGDVVRSPILWTREDDGHDSFRAIKGIVLGCLLSIPFWLCLALVLRAALT